jgi:hypothetical protein
LRHVTANASFASYHFRNALLEDFLSPGPFDMVSEPFCYFFAFQDHSGLPLVVPKSYGSVENKWEDIILRIDGIAKVFNTIKR